MLNNLIWTTPESWLSLFKIQIKYSFDDQDELFKTYLSIAAENIAINYLDIDLENFRQVDVDSLMKNNRFQMACLHYTTDLYENPDILRTNDFGSVVGNTMIYRILGNLTQYYGVYGVTTSQSKVAPVPILLNWGEITGNIQDQIDLINYFNQYVLLSSFNLVSDLVNQHSTEIILIQNKINEHNASILDLQTKTTNLQTTTKKNTDDIEINKTNITKNTTNITTNTTNIENIESNYLTTNTDQNITSNKNFLNKVSVINPTNDSDASNKYYVDLKFSEIPPSTPTSWGTIIGNLDNQLDLINKFNKYATTTITDNLKTNIDTNSTNITINTKDIANNKTNITTNTNNITTNTTNITTIKANYVTTNTAQDITSIKAFYGALDLKTTNNFVFFRMYNKEGIIIANYYKDSANNNVYYKVVDHLIFITGKTLRVRNTGSIGYKEDVVNVEYLNQRLSNIPTPTTSTAAANKAYVDAKIPPITKSINSKLYLGQVLMFFSKLERQNFVNDTNLSSIYNFEFFDIKTVDSLILKAIKITKVLVSE